MGGQTQSTLQLWCMEKVKIQNYGWSKSNGTGKKINCILGNGYVTKVESGGVPYPIRLSSAPSGGQVIGYFKRSDIKVIK